MKNSLLLLPFLLFTFAAAIAQDQTKKENSKEANNAIIESDTYNKWTVEVIAGQSKGIRPYNQGYFSSNPERAFGSFQFNSFGLGVRYMLSPKFGLKLDGNFEKFENNNDTKSKKFRTQQLRFGIQGVINASRLLDIEEILGRWGLLIHGGIAYGRFTPKLDSGIDPDLNPSPNNPNAGGGVSNYGSTENTLGMMFGISPEFRITKRISIIGDFTTVTNFRQHFAWDGHYAKENQDLSAQMINGSLGLTYSFGAENFHGDWAIVEDKKTAAFVALDKRIGELENMLNDTDKDGVPDYIDIENNSIAGVAVDSKGKMIDINTNGIPDELEGFRNTDSVTKENTTTTTTNEEMIKRLINEGYVTTYFDTNKTKPTNVSTQGIDFILTYLRNNPSMSVDIIGNADEIGKSAYNDSLAMKRAQSVKAILIKAGINASRLHVVSNGEDASVSKDSEGARKLVRRVTFKVK